MKISSKDNPVIKYLTRLYNNKKERDESSLFIIEGYHLVEEAYKAGIIKQIYSIKEEELYKDSIIITIDLLKKITDTINPEGIIAVCHKINNSNCGEKVLYLDSLQDPGNVGTLLRSALAFNFNTIILDNSVDLYNPKTIRSSQGALFHLNYINKSLMNLKNDGYFIISTSMKGCDFDSFICSNKKICLILGNEGCGVRREYQMLSDVNLTISMNLIESLNVGVAGSIIMNKLKK